MTIKKTFVAQHKPQVILEKSGSVWTSSDNEKCTPPCHLGKHIRGFSSISSHPHWWTPGASMATLEKASFGHAESKLNVLRILANISLEHMHMLLSHCSDQICDKKQLWWDFFFRPTFWVSTVLQLYGGRKHMAAACLHLSGQKAEKTRRVARLYPLRPIPYRFSSTRH